MDVEREGGSIRGRGESLISRLLPDLLSAALSSLGRDAWWRQSLTSALLAIPDSPFISPFFIPAALPCAPPYTCAVEGTLLLIFPVTSVCLFALFVVLGVVRRHHAEAHKRLMLLATANLIIPALARIVMQATSGVPGVVGAVILVNGFLIAMAVHDFSTRGKLHPVTLWGGGFVLLSEPLRFVVGFSAPWQAFAQMVMG